VGELQEMASRAGAELRATLSAPASKA
jgi:hypothetical protein